MVKKELSLNLTYNVLILICSFDFKYIGLCLPQTDTDEMQRKKKN